MGLLNGGQQGQQPDNSQQAKQGGKASPETQEVYDKFVANGIKIIHTPKFTDSLISEIQQSKDKTSIIGERALQVVERLEASAEKNGVKTTANTILNGMNTIVGLIVEVVETAGVEKLDDEQKYQAFSWAISNYINNAYKSGKISKEELIALGKKMEGAPQMGGEIPEQTPEQMPQAQGGV